MRRSTVSLVVTARPSWAKWQPVLDALSGHDEIRVDVVACASAVLTRYGDVSRYIHETYPQLSLTRLYSTLEGGTGVTSAKETGVLLMSLADHFARVQPTFVLVMADRYETLAATMAARYQNRPVIHLQGGEWSGNVDDVVRDANTALATYHFPATAKAWTRVRAITKQPSAHIWNFGCPSIDVARASRADPPVTMDELGGRGASFSTHEPFIIVLQHSETDHPDQAFAQMRTTLAAVRLTGLPMVVFWPGNDAGTDETSKAIRIWTDMVPRYPCHTVRTLPPRRFLRLLQQARALVGNSSTGLREASYLGVPVVDVGTRQQGREGDTHVLRVPADAQAIATALHRHGPCRYPPATTYGDGTAGPRIAEKICEWSRS